MEKRIIDTLHEEGRQSSLLKKLLLSAVSKLLHGEMKGRKNVW